LVLSEETQENDEPEGGEDDTAGDEPEWQAGEAEAPEEEQLDPGLWDNDDHQTPPPLDDQSKGAQETGDDLTAKDAEKPPEIDAPDERKLQPNFNGKIVLMIILQDENEQTEVQDDQEEELDLENLDQRPMEEESSDELETGSACGDQTEETEQVEEMDPVEPENDGEPQETHADKDEIPDATVLPSSFGASGAQRSQEEENATMQPEPAEQIEPENGETGSKDNQSQKPTGGGGNSQEISAKRNNYSNSGYEKAPKRPKVGYWQYFCEISVDP